MGGIRRDGRGSRRGAYAAVHGVVCRVRLGEIGGHQSFCARQKAFIKCTEYVGLQLRVKTNGESERNGGFGNGVKERGQGLVHAGFTRGSGGKS